MSESARITRLAALMAGNGFVLVKLIDLSTQGKSIVIAWLGCGAALGMLLAYLSLRRGSTDRWAREFEWASLGLLASAFFGWAAGAAFPFPWH
jgi:hypothetical protein